MGARERLITIGNQLEGTFKRALDRTESTADLRRVARDSSFHVYLTLLGPSARCKTEVRQHCGKACQPATHMGLTGLVLNSEQV
jgi:hypothetical protein